MVIASYQVKNVLKVYGDRLRLSKAVYPTAESLDRQGYRSDISGDAGREAFTEKVAARVLDKIIREGSVNEAGKDLLTGSQKIYSKNLAVSPDKSEGLLFKVIDEQGEALHSLSIENSNFLTRKLKAVTIKSAVNIVSRKDYQAIKNKEKFVICEETGRRRKMSRSAKEMKVVREFLASFAHVRSEKVALMREKIKSGTYRINYEGVADKVVEAFIEDLI
ncbi:MAG: flagellar biosynthesis anti-sigma factor FlgM [Deltaproteobacteria bacterium]|nr:flagellar biosynthesis anti-sigma factor FlgM [Deltaproteobacteria bacterium]